MNRPPLPPRTEWIDRTESLAEAVSELRREPEVAIDTEADSFFSYHVKICLIQISGRDRHWLVDPLAPDIELDPLGELMEDPDVVKVLHAAGNDLALFRLQYGFRARRIWDTMVAAQVLGLPRTGLGNLLEERFGVVTPKRFQRSDWRVRPLEEGQLAYAVLDTAHLLELKEQLDEELERLDRVEEAQEEFDLLEDTPPARAREYDPEAFRRASGARGMDPGRLRVLSELFATRERIADRRDLSPHRIAPDRVLVEIAERRPRSARELDRIRGLPARMRRRAEPWLDAVERAGEMGPMPPRPRKAARGGEPPFTSAQKRLFERLRDWRRDRAEGRGVEAFRVATTAALKNLVRVLPRDRDELAEVEGMSPFRCREYGEEILDLVRRTTRGT